MSGEVLAPLMFFALLLFLFMGYPVAFVLGGTGLLFAGIGALTGAFDWNLLYALPPRIFGVMSNSVLLAVPFFIFMGTMLEKSKLAEDLLTTIGTLFGPVRGGLAFAVVAVGTLLAAATGVVGASVVAMGLISLPVMLRYGYSRPFAAGVIMASGTLGQIIPPSVVLVVLADQMGVSVGDLFLGALVPGLCLSGLFAIYVLAIALARPHDAPALPAAERQGTPRDLAKRVLVALAPPLVLILLVLGGIFTGVATPTDGGALGATGTIVLALVAKRLTRAGLRAALEETTKLTAIVAFLLIGSTIFTLVFRGLSGDIWIEGLLTSLPGSRTGFLVVVCAIVFSLGFFIDFFEIVFIVLPLILPAARALEIDLVWFGVLLGMILQTSFLTPPFGFALFYLRGVAPKELTTLEIYRGALPFIAVQIAASMLVWAFPGLVLNLVR